MAHTHRVFVSLLAAAALSACSGLSGSVPPSPNAASPAASRPAANPPPCSGQSTTSEYATSETQTVASKPASMCVPAFGGFGGTIQLPAAKPSITATATTSTTNYNQTLPSLGKKGKPLLYLQLVTSATTAFGKKFKSSGGLAGKSLKTGNDYTVYGEAKLAGVAGITMTFTPCVAKASAGKYGGVISGIGSLLAAQRIDTPAVMYFEIYRGKHAAATC
jgi:hypothetical protein